MERLPNLHPGSPGFRATAPAGATASEANKLAIALENKLAIARRPLGASLCPYFLPAFQETLVCSPRFGSFALLLRGPTESLCTERMRVASTDVGHPCDKYANSQLGVGARPLGRLIIAPLKRYRNCRAPLLILQACMASLAGRPSKRQRLDARHVQDTCSLDLGQGAHVDYAKAAFAEAQATQLLERIKQGAALEQRPVVIMGRRVLQPRLTAFQGDPGCIYKYRSVVHPLGPGHTRYERLTPPVPALQRRRDAVGPLGCCGVGSEGARRGTGGVGVQCLLAQLVPKRSGQPGLALRQRKVARPHDRYSSSATNHPGCPPGVEGRRAGSGRWGNRLTTDCAPAARRVGVARRAARLRAASKHRPLGPPGVFAEPRRCADYEGHHPEALDAQRAKACRRAGRASQPYLPPGGTPRRPTQAAAPGGRGPGGRPRCTGAWRRFCGL